MNLRLPALAVFLSLAAACSSSSDDAAPAAEPTYDAPGPNGVSHTTLSIDDPARMRKLEVTVWYPTATHGPGVAPAELYPAGARRDALAAAFSAAPSACVRQSTTSVADLPPIAGALPLVMFSHCSGCFRTSSSALAERLASRGFVVAAPDHEGNTLFDAMPVGVTPEFLEIRRGDIARVLDVLLDASAKEVPDTLRGRIDATKVGMLGHSFGALTTGEVTWSDPRIRAAFALAAPLELIGKARVAEMKVPLGFLLAEEDHSIGPGGNGLIRDQANKKASPPVWLGEAADAGHWSFSDVPGLTTSFMPGCGMAKRQEDTSESFTYVEPETARRYAAKYVSTFFLGHLLGVEAAKAELAKPTTGVVVTVR